MDELIRDRSATSSRVAGQEVEDCWGIRIPLCSGEQALALLERPQLQPHHAGIIRLYRSPIGPR